MIETRWWLIRHAPVTAHGGRIYGARDLPCDTSSRRVFRRLAERLPEGAVWVTSHLTRTHQTADAILQEMAPDPLPERLSEPALGEQDFGDWQGMTHEELAGIRDGAWHRFWLAPAHERPPGGESFEDLTERVNTAVARLNERYRGRNIVAVTHGGTIRAKLALALGLSPERALAFEIANCSLSRLDFIEGATGSHAAETTGAWRVGHVNLLSD
jgi:broad specificity phosphatase PhoE